MWKSTPDGILKSVLNFRAITGSAKADYHTPRMATAVTDREKQESARRLYKVEQKLMWVRRIALLGWGGMILWEAHPIGLDLTWIAYVISLIYCVYLHSHLRNPKNLLLISWFGAVGDSIVTFLMCLSMGGVASEFIPFFYFTILASAFRFGGQKSVVILFFNTILVVALGLAEPETSRDWKTIISILSFLGYSFAFGSLMAEWAISNLRRALIQSQELEVERDRSQELLHRLINAQEEERRKMADDLHDRTGERLFSINHGLDEFIREATDVNIRNRLESLRSELLGCTSYIRSFMNELRPTVLDELGLCEAISEYVATIRDVVPFAIEINLDSTTLRYWRSKEDAMLFRLMQEALLNARKHAGAKSVQISLQKEGDSVVLAIEDDGRGFDTSCTPVGHFGLLSMRERAEVSGGILSIESKLQHGTKVSVRFNNHG